MRIDTGIGLMENETKPESTPSQLYQDWYYLTSNKSLIHSPVGKIVLILHDLSDFGKVKTSARWYRRWIRVSDNKTDLIQWVFDGMQLGNFKEDSLFKEL